ncbi:hypothetical protein FACS18947_5450 [Bacteroidia bacterium]|nr:hypothetical protein FACS18947_5450 [Bacteroidia bacterium]
MREVLLKELAHSRSGDKSDTSNICVFARKPEDYSLLSEQLTVEAVKAHFGNMVTGDVVRYDLPKLAGFNFVLHHALGGGATHSLRLDTLGKSMGSAILRMKIKIGG